MSKRYYLITIVLCLIAISSVCVVFSSLPQQIPLWFTFPWGEGRLAPRNYIFVIPILIILIMIANLLLGKLLKKYPPIMGTVLAITSALTAVMLIIALIGILQSIL